MDQAMMQTARLRASATRSGFMMSLAGGDITMDDVLDSYPDVPELGKIRLVDLLAAQPGVSYQRARRIIVRFRRFANRRFPGAYKKVPEKPTISYLRHSQAGPAMARAWKMSMGNYTHVPWAGFPWTSEPNEDTSQSLVNGSF